jgi:D-galactarolactone isomerase
MMLVRPLTGTPLRTPLPAGAVDVQTHMYLPGYPALEGGPPIPAGELPTPEQYRQVMDWLGIDRVIVTQGNAHQRDNENLLAALADMQATRPDTAWGVAAVPGDIAESELDRYAKGRIIGLRIMDLPGGGVNLDHLEAVDTRAAERGFMVAVQFDGSNIETHEPRLAKMKSRWVLDHHGKFFCGVTPDSPQIASLKRLIDTGRCWFKFTGPYESSKTGGPDFADIAAFSKAIANHAPERVVWGTNWPHNLAKEQADYPDDAALTDTVLGWLSDEKARHLALVENPEELYGLPKWGAAHV